ncbi:hypothetical protein ACFPN0_07815 [Kitasatospora cinereorecta]
MISACRPAPDRTRFASPGPVGALVKGRPAPAQDPGPVDSGAAAPTGYGRRAGQL